MLYLKTITSLASIQCSSDYTQKKKYNAMMIDFQTMNNKNISGYSKKLLKIHKVCHTSYNCK